MCGRFALTATPDQVRQLFRYIEKPEFPERYNICPNQPIAIVKNEHGGRHFDLARWGLIPSWVKDPASFTLLINARAETILEKPSFRNAMKHRRCLIPMSGFYEWRRTPSGKQPYFFARPDGEPFAVAGIWETFCDPAGGELDTAALITVEANGVMKPIHHRMPAIIQPDGFDEWLDTGNIRDKEAFKQLHAAADDVLVAWPVSQRINMPTNDDPSLIEEYSPQDEEENYLPNQLAKRNAVKERELKGAHADDSDDEPAQEQLKLI
ncbi:SOS response-associated peptidase [Rhodobacteraceae bacterium RKSG542]|uniref:SOS response-associated peptidase n=1 Tax=Pseudovibrio flavus TaxID=2529854 RepID=UPI0012BC626C|nr:SOS response-associated peptidase [Pseudovibrio flavus]MTI18719.1 SOS response-associated peptidase [Pseudovibrio flavus]